MEGSSYEGFLGFSVDYVEFFFHIKFDAKQNQN